MPWRWHHEPLTLFALGAALLFGIDNLVRPAPPNQIHISSEQILALASFHAHRTGRTPSATTLRAAVDELVEDEALLRHGVALGIVDGDPIVRRRIVSKMRQAARGTAEPTVSDLERWYADRSELFDQSAMTKVEHRFYGTATTGQTTAHNALSAAVAGGPPPGRPLALGPRLAFATSAQLERWLGDDAARRARGAPIGEWFGPVESSYGWHIVRVVARRPARRRPLSEVRHAVRRDYLRQARADAERATVRRIVDAHDVVIDWPSASMLNGRRAEAQP